MALEVPQNSSNRPQRPKALFEKRCRSRSPSPAIRSNLKELTPNPPSSLRTDLDALRNKLEHNNGLFTFNSQRFTAKCEDFEILGFLGKGTCGSVHKMQHKSKKQFITAVKIMRSSDNEQEYKRNLVDLDVMTKEFKCPNIVKCFGVIFTTTEFWICMEIMVTCLHRLLYHLKTPFPENVLGKINASIVIALEHLKRKYNFIHRDLKPSNMLISHHGVIKLCDFGISGQLKDSIALSKQMGCLGYMSPERLSAPIYDARADIWSLGISLIEMATCSFPYGETTVEFAILSKIISGKSPSLPENTHFSPAFRRYVDKCLIKDRESRPKYPELMSSDFFKLHSLKPPEVSDWINGLLPDNYKNTSQWTLDMIKPGSLSSSSSDSPASLDTLSPVSEENECITPTVTLVSSPSSRLNVNTHSDPLATPTPGCRRQVTTSRVAARDLHAPRRLSTQSDTCSSQSSSGYGSSSVSESSPIPNKPVLPARPSQIRSTANEYPVKADEPSRLLLSHSKYNQNSPDRRERLFVPSSLSLQTTTTYLTPDNTSTKNSHPVRLRSSSVNQIRRTPARRWQAKPIAGSSSKSNDSTTTDEQKKKIPPVVPPRPKALSSLIRVRTAPSTMLSNNRRSAPLEITITNDDDKSGGGQKSLELEKPAPPPRNHRSRHWQFPLPPPTMRALSQPSPTFNPSRQTKV